MVSLKKSWKHKANQDVFLYGNHRLEQSSHCFHWKRYSKGPRVPHVPHPLHSLLLSPCPLHSLPLPPWLLELLSLPPPAQWLRSWPLKMVPSCTPCFRLLTKIQITWLVISLTGYSRASSSRVPLSPGPIMRGSLDLQPIDMLSSALWEAWIERMTRNSRTSKMLQQSVYEFFLQSWRWLLWNSGEPIPVALSFYFYAWESFWSHYSMFSSLQMLDSYTVQIRNGRDWFYGRDVHFTVA